MGLEVEWEVESGCVSSNPCATSQQLDDLRQVHNVWSCFILSIMGVVIPSWRAFDKTDRGNPREMALHSAASHLVVWGEERSISPSLTLWLSCRSCDGCFPPV